MPVKDLSSALSCARMENAVAEFRFLPKNLPSSFLIWVPEDVLHEDCSLATTRTY